MNDPRSPSPVRDDAADGAVALLAGVGVACTGGLLLALLGIFSAPLVLAAGAVTTVLAWRGRVRAAADAPRRPTWDVLLVAALGMAFLLPGYDVSVHGSDATVYVGAGAHLARTGTLAIADPLLEVLGPTVSRAMFPWQGERLPWVPRARDTAGLMFVGQHGPVYSTFAAVSAVWLGCGSWVAGSKGAAAVTPLFGAGALVAVYLAGRRTMAGPFAGLAVALLGLALPQAFFARFPLAEVPAQYFLWAATAALARFAETRGRAPAVAAGLGLACLVLARTEYVAFLLGAAALAGVLGMATRLGLPRTTRLLAVVGCVAAIAVPLLVVPTHYRVPFLRLLAGVGLSPARATALLEEPAVAASLAGVLLTAGVGAALRFDRAWPRWLRVVLGVGIAGWLGVYAVESGSPVRGRTAELLAQMVGWPVVVAGVPGAVVWGWTSVRDRWARLAVLLGAVAGFHVLVDMHVSYGALWASRRLLPVVLPAFCLGIGRLAATVAGRRPLGAALAGVAGVALVAQVAWLTWPVWREPLYRDTGPQVAALAETMPPDALVVLDGSLRETLLDVPLWLVHGRNSVQLPTPAGDMEFLRAMAALSAFRPVYFLAMAAMPPPKGQFLRFEAAGTRTIRVRLPGVTSASGQQSTSLIPVRIQRVWLDLSGIDLPAGIPR